MKKLMEIYHPMSMWTTNDHLSLADLTRSQTFEPDLKNQTDQMEVQLDLDLEKPLALEKPTVHARRNKSIFKPGNWNIT